MFRTAVHLFVNKCFYKFINTVILIEFELDRMSHGAITQFFFMQMDDKSKTNGKDKKPQFQST